MYFLLPFTLSQPPAFSPTIFSVVKKVQRVSPERVALHYSISKICTYRSFSLLDRTRNFTSDNRFFKAPKSAVSAVSSAQHTSRYIKLRHQSAKHMAEFEFEQRAHEKPN